MIGDILYIDTLFSSIPYIRGYKCFQMFTYTQSKYDRIVLMKWEVNTPKAYEDLIRSVGSPNKTGTDNDQVLTGKKWTNVNCIYCIGSGLTVSHHQHQHYCEGVGGNFKLAVIKLFHNTPHAPLKYWCFAASFFDKIRRFLSKSSIGGRCGH